MPAGQGNDNPSDVTKGNEPIDSHNTAQFNQNDTTDVNMPVSNEGGSTALAGLGFYVWNYAS